MKHKTKQEKYDFIKVSKNIYKEDRNGHISYKVIYKGSPAKRFNSFEEADKYRSSLVVDDDNAETETKSECSFSFYCEKLLEYLKKEKKISTYTTKRDIIKKIILPNFEDKKMKDITKEDCSKFRDYIGNTNYSTNYKNAVIVVFKQIFHRANFLDEINIDCIKLVSKFPETEEEKMNSEYEEDSVYEPEDFKKMISCVSSNYYKTLFTLLITSWIRIGEAQGLKWIDFKNNSIRIRRNIVKVSKDINPKCFVEVSPKTKNSKRLISLPQNVCDMLDSLKKKQMEIPGFSEEWYIFNRWNGGKYKDGTYPMSKTCIARAFDKAIKQSGVKKIRIHDLRGSGATHAIAGGEDIKAVSERLGHADIETTLSVYHHVISKTKNRLIKNTDDYV